MPLHLSLPILRFYISIPQLPLDLTLECRILLVAFAGDAVGDVMKILPLTNAYLFILIATYQGCIKNLEYCWEIYKYLYFLQIYIYILQIYVFCKTFPNISEIRFCLFINISSN